MSADKERDWDKELAAIDKAMEHWKPPVEEAAAPAPAPAAAPAPVARKSAPGGVAGAPAAAPAAAPAIRFHHRFGTWFRVVLGLLIGIGMTQWPYTHGCGFRLMFYLTGAVAVVAAGSWSAWSSWKRQMGWAHGLSIALAAWGLILLAREVLPRVGYAKQEATWLCRGPVSQPSPGSTP